MNVSRLWPVAAFVVFGIVCLIAGIWLRVVYEPEWMSPDTTQQPTSMRPWAVEADCYSQLARVQRILKGQGLIQNHFAVENWPEGLTPSTTAPFDYAILLLYAPLCLFTKHPLDWAGALVSPALWVALVFFWTFIRSREFNLAGRALFLIGSAALPAFLWATACGRPRHQSLILALMAMGLTAEYERWQIELTPKRAWNIFAGIVWGLACWTSLFEPSIVITCLVLFNLIVRRKENFAFLASFACVMVVAFALEGTHTLTASLLLIHPPAEYSTALTRWLSTIGEVRHYDYAGMSNRLDAADLAAWLELLLDLAMPFIAWRILKQYGMRGTDLFLVILTVLLWILTGFERRWTYYASLAELFLIVRYCQGVLDGGMKLLSRMALEGAEVWPPSESVMRMVFSRTTRAVILVLFFLGLFFSDYQETKDYTRHPANQPSLELAQVAHSIDGPGGIMAPWWLSPGLLYFSGNPIVSGSSHCGISGIVASAKFYTSTSWIDAEKILVQHKVRWIVVWDDPRYEYPLLNSSFGILGQPIIPDDDHKGDADRTTAQLLITDQYLPTAFHLCGVTSQMKLYEFVPDGQ